ncbi:MAG: cupin domain-containing protein [Anaerolineales bacterium]|nr:cupin domain-containing protein [Anaerolineales bacterium]
MFYHNVPDNFQKVLDGIEIKTLVFGDKMLLSEFHMKRGSALPMHSHPQEQTGRLLQGKIILSIGGEKMEMTPGDCWSVPGDTEHGAEILEDSTAIEVFSPVREDYKQYYRKA